MLNLTDEEIEVAPFVLPDADKINGGANAIGIAREGCYEKLTCEILSRCSQKGCRELPTWNSMVTAKNLFMSFTIM